MSNFSNLGFRTIPKASLFTAFALLAVAGASCTQSQPAAKKTESLTGGPVLVLPSEQQEWKLQWSSECADEVEECFGKNAFTIRNTGSWLVGPASTGETYDGDLEIVERKNLDQLVRTAADAITSDESCADASELAAAAEPQGIRNGTLTLEFRGTTQVVALKDGKICSTLSGDSSKRLASLFLEQMGKYHPSVFPDECLTLSRTVENAYAPLQGCQRDSDCAWLDTTYTPVFEGEVQFVMTDSCTKLRPLVSANTSLMTESAIEGLQNARAELYDTCGASIARVNCVGIAGFESTMAQPVCDLGRCRAPSIELNYSHALVR